MFRVSEKFKSVTGEGNRTGNLSIWVRLFGCNLKCPGFYQNNPTDPSSYEPSYQSIDASAISKLDDLPVVKTGCDTFYSWDSKYRHLSTTYNNATELMKDIEPLLYDGQWIHSVTGNKLDLCITGGEPMMQQKVLIDIMESADVSKNEVCVQIETNGTLEMSEEFREYIIDNDIDLNWNISPKLYNVSGEKDAVKYDVIQNYSELSNGVLKFVINNTDAAWDELNDHVVKLQSMGVELPIMIMPVGATYEQQTDVAFLSEIANRAINNGFHISGRLHAILFGNAVGT